MSVSVASWKKAALTSSSPWRCQEDIIGTVSSCLHVYSTVIILHDESQWMTEASRLSWCKCTVPLWYLQFRFVFFFTLKICFSQIRFFMRLTDRGKRAFRSLFNSHQRASGRRRPWRGAVSDRRTPASSYLPVKGEQSTETFHSERPQKDSPGILFSWWHHSTMVRF